MKALTLVQPWATLVAMGIKDVENRSWSPPPDLIGQRIAIHAGGKYEAAGSYILQRLSAANRAAIEEVEEFVQSAIIGLATIARVVSRSDSKWFEGPVGWCLEDPVRLVKPIACNGQLKLWSLSKDQLRLLVKQVPELKWDRK